MSNNLKRLSEAGQAIWLGVLMARGWYYQDDLAFFAQARQRGLGFGYLTAPVNDHLTPGLRLGFWLLQPLGASAYGVTIALRLLMQAGATLWLDRLMVRLAGRPGWGWRCSPVMRSRRCCSACSGSARRSACCPRSCS